MLEIVQYLFIAVGINILLFIPAYLFRTDKLTDLSYSATFMIISALALLFNEFSITKLILAVMIFVWALRLGVFLLIRIRAMKKDRRFDGMRESFVKFLTFWILQGVAVWIILIPSLLFIHAKGSTVIWFGFIVWIVGLLIETVADYQKFRHRQKSTFIQSGLWKYSRHPNYFGEMLCWAGMYLFVFPSLVQWQQLVALISPVFISTLLVFVTGIPPLEKYAEKKWGKERAYQEYKRRTSILIPWFRR